MATTAAQLKKLEREVDALKKKVARLERKNGEQVASTRKRTRDLTEAERVDEILERAGLLAELTPGEKAMAEEWDALPEERKREVILKLDSLRLDPPLSQLIHDQRR